MILKLDKPFISRLVRLTVPIAFQSFMLACVAAADSFMLGRLDQCAMAAVSLATQVQFVQNMFIFAITSAGIILAAQYWGKGDKKTVEAVFCMILRHCGIISIVFCLLCEFVPGYLMKLFTSDPGLISVGASYLRIAGWSYLLTGITQCYLTIMKVAEHAVSSALISSAGVILNVLLNAVLIFGLFGLPAMSADGAALATLLARIVELLLAVLLSFRADFIQPSLKGLFHGNRILFRDYLTHLLPLTGGSLLWGVGITVYTAVIGHVSVDATAANAISAVVRELMCCLCNGVSNAGGIIVGNELGKGSLDTGKSYGDRITVISAIVGLLSCFLVFAVTPVVTAFVKLEPMAKSYLTGMMLIMGVYMIARSINGVVINGVFASGGDTRFDVYSLTVCMWMVSIPMAFLSAFVFRLPVYVVYLFTCFDEIVKLPWVYAHYKKYKWVKDLTRDQI